MTQIKIDGATGYLHTRRIRNPQIDDVNTRWTTITLPQNAIDAYSDTLDIDGDGRLRFRYIAYGNMRIAHTTLPDGSEVLLDQNAIDELGEVELKLSVTLHVSQSTPTVNGVKISITGTK